jgi:hypothetical protein
MVKPPSRLYTGNFVKNFVEEQKWSDRIMAFSNITEYMAKSTNISLYKQEALFNGVIIR